ncbi:class I SAM-dependent methyltransferase [Micromonospora sp. NPDC049523]|uniref:class I SAM-dependent methyltransferase n=1 Tax=Micromonospora sp. NPDC049523 TaxID=3155921 RepID=UPI00342108D3
MKSSTDLTSTESWDQLWSQPRSGGVASRVKQRLKATRTWHQLLADLLDSTGREGPVDVLELGCAPGSMLLQLHQLRPMHTYHGLDFAPEGLKTARRLLHAAGVPANLRLGDVRTAELPPVDLVLSFGLVEHFEEPGEIMAHHRRFLRPGGVAAVTVPNYAHPALVALLRRFSPETLATHNLRVMSEDSLRTAFASAGLVDIVTGVSGGPTMPNSRVRPDLSGSSYRFAARTWNACSGLLPDGWPWSANIWATGVQPG